MMSQADHYEMLVLGSGEAGKYIGWHMARSGRRTAVIERSMIGGACPNTNCLPSKNEIWSAKVAHLARHGSAFGVTTGTVGVDMALVRARKRDMVNGLITMHLDAFKASGTELIMGSGRFTAPKTIEVALNDGGGTRVLTGDRVVICTGSHAVMPAIPGLAAVAPMTNVELLELDRLPEHLIVIGGGYIGLELAQACRRFGSAVTLLETGRQIAAREDPDVSAELLQMLRDEGMVVHLEAKVASVSGQSGSGVSVQLRTPAEEFTLQGSDILVATGRAPNTSGIGLDLADVAKDDRGFIAVNDRLETSAPDTYAVGDCAGSPQFTHAAFDDFRILRENFSGGQRGKGDRMIPYCMFTDPPLARVGLSETEAQRQGVAVRVAKLPVVSVLRSRTISETRGFLKALVEAQGDRILGFTMIGPEAGEVMAVVQTAMLAGMPYTGLRDAILTHPTMAEGLVGLFTNVPARA